MSNRGYDDNCAGKIQKGINCFVCIEVEANNNIGM